MKTNIEKIARLVALPALTAAIGVAAGNYFTAKRITETSRLCDGAKLRCQMAGLNELRAGRPDEAQRFFEYVAGRDADAVTFGYLAPANSSRSINWLFSPRPKDTTQTSDAMHEAVAYASAYPK